MCNCIKEVEEKMKAAMKAKSATLQAGLQVGKVKGAMRTYLNCTVEVEGKKKPQVVQLTLKYCPFCGEKYEDLDAKGVADNG